MSFSLRAKNRAWNRCNVRLIQQDLRRGAAVLVNSFCIGKCIESSRWRSALQANLVQPGHQQVAPFAVLLTQPRDLRGGSCERVNHRVLYRRGDAVGGGE